MNAATAALAAAHVSARDILALRVCRKCGAIGRVDSQGRVEFGEKLQRKA